MDPTLIFILVLAFGAMWLMSSRTRKQQRQAGDFRANLEVGQEVMTGSGFYGTIVEVDGDTITLESTPGNESRWIRAAVSKLVEPPVDTEADDEADDELDEYDDDYTADDAADDDYNADDAADDDAADDDAADDELDEATSTAAAADDVIEVPDDLSTLPGQPKDDDPHQK